MWCKYYAPFLLHPVYLDNTVYIFSSVFLCINLLIDFFQTKFALCDVKELHSNDKFVRAFAM
jgi:hypothetical protein